MESDSSSGEGFILGPSYSQEKLLKRGCMLPEAEGGSKFRDLRKGEKLNQLLINIHFVLIDGGGQVVLLIIYKT